MSDKATLLALAERVEAAAWPQPTRELNREVALAVGWFRRTPSESGKKYPTWIHPDDCRNGQPVFDSLHGTEIWREPSNYLGSLDAALTLVPEGHVWLVANVGLNDEGKGPLSGKCSAISAPPADTEHIEPCEAATPALALCAAALRARAETQP